jgi:hypothetical protein
METGHTETVVEKAVAYVKDMFGAGPDHNHVESAGGPIVPSSVGEPAPGTETETAKIDDDFPVKSATEMNAQSARREDGE